MKKILFIILIIPIILSAQSFSNRSGSGAIFPPQIILVSPMTEQYNALSQEMNISVNIKNIKEEKDIEFSVLKELSGGLDKVSPPKIVNKRITPDGYEIQWYVSLHDGTNEYEITAKNNNGIVKKKLTLIYQPYKLPQIWAVVVGISKYQKENLKLNFADKDAQLFYEFLRSPFGGGLSENNSILLVNEQATRENIIKALNDKLNRAFDEDMVIIYFAGHGMPDPVGNEVYFLSYDAKPDNLAGTAVSHLDIDRALSKSRARKKIWIADACHSGGATVSTRGDYASLTHKLLFEIAEKKEGTALFMSASGSEFSMEDIKWGTGHGVFTYSLIEGLKGKADKDNDALVSIRELYDYVYRQVVDETQGQQHPQLNGSFDNRLPLSIIESKIKKK